MLIQKLQEIIVLISILHIQLAIVNSTGDGLIISALFFLIGSVENLIAVHFGGLCNVQGVLLADFVDSRLLFNAEEIRDEVLHIAGDLILEREDRVIGGTELVSANEDSAMDDLEVEDLLSKGDSVFIIFSASLIAIENIRDHHDHIATGQVGAKEILGRDAVIEAEFKRISTGYEFPIFGTDFIADKAGQHGGGLNAVNVVTRAEIAIAVTGLMYAQLIYGTYHCPSSTSSKYGQSVL